MKSPGRTVLFWLFIAVLATVLWKMTARGSGSVFVVFIVVLAFVGLPLGIGLATNFITRRAERKRLARLANLFDNGTVETQSAAYEAGTSVVGTFQGRRAEISIDRVVPGPNIRISLAGHFSLLFQVRARTISKAGAARFVFWVVLFGFWLYLDVRGWTKPGDSVWKLTAMMWTFLSVFQLVQGVRNYRKFGKSEFYRHSTLPVSFPGSECLEFSSVSPATFGAVIERREIQDAVLRLVRSRQIDLLSVAYVHRLGTSAFQIVGNTIEANYYYRKQWLKPEHMQAVLLDLLVLCQDLEAVR